MLGLIHISELCQVLPPLLTLIALLTPSPILTLIALSALATPTLAPKVPPSSIYSRRIFP